MFHIIKPGTNFDFVGKRFLFLGLSALCLLGTVGLFFQKGLNYGIDFTGGAEIQIKVPNTWEISKVRSTLLSGGLENVKVQQIGSPEDSEFIVRAQGDESSLNQVSGKVAASLQKELSTNEFELQRVDVVGAAAGSLLRKNGLLAMFYALLAILIYVAFRFDTKYAPGAVMALFHDSLIVLGIFMLTGRQFDLTILAALLVLIGYSNNDTIIVFDRVRETTQLHPEYPIERAVNRAINETLARTIITSVTTFFAVGALYQFGGAVIENFAFALMCGVVVGTYSSIFIASSLIIQWTNYFDRREAKLRNQGTKKKKREYKVRAEAR